LKTRIIITLTRTTSQFKITHQIRQVTLKGYLGSKHGIV